MAELNSVFLWLAAIQIMWLLLGVYRFLQKNDEFVLVPALFLIYCGSYRYLAATLGWFEWGSMAAYGLPVTSNPERALAALRLMVLGESALLASYVWTQRAALIVSSTPVPGKLLAQVSDLMPWVWVGSLMLVMGVRHLIAKQAALGEDNFLLRSSYINQIPYILIAVALLTTVAFRFDILHSPFQKGAAICFLAAVAWLTFGPTGRFQTFGWVIGGAYILGTRKYGAQRLPFLVVGLAIALGAFAAGGALRDYKAQDVSLEQSSIGRAVKGDDANMLDGLVYVMAVFPDMLPYDLGREHLRILARPIPRQLWPDKPIGSYMYRLGFFDVNGSEPTVGISPTLFGSFYQEGGWVGVVLLSLLYGWLAGRLVLYSVTLRPIFSVLIRGLVLAGSIPLLRGGDLPGIYAWLGMAFWPALLFIWWNRRWLHDPAVPSQGKRAVRKRRGAATQALPTAQVANPGQRGKDASRGVRSVAADGLH